MASKTQSTASDRTPETIDALEFAQNLILAYTSNTIYVNGCFGASFDVERAVRKYAVKTKNSYNKEHAEEIKATAGKHYFGFDCISLIKSVGWWEWSADSSKLYGGAVYKARNMPDCSVHAMMRDHCYTNHDLEKTSQIPWLGFVATKSWDHIAVHIGGNNVLEATRYGDAKVRRAHIKGMPYVRESDRLLPVRTFDLYALCKYINYANVAQITSCDGLITYTAAAAFEGSGEYPMTVEQYFPSK